MLSLRISSIRYQALSAMPKVILMMPSGSRVVEGVCAGATVGTLNYILASRGFFLNGVTYTRQGDQQATLCACETTARLYPKEHPEEDVWQVEVVSVIQPTLALQNFVSVVTCIRMVGSDEEDAASNVAVAGSDTETTDQVGCNSP